MRRRPSFKAEPSAPAELIAVDCLRGKGADYADARNVSVETEWLKVRNGAVESFVYAAEAGLGVRVLAAGCWGAASTLDRSGKAVEKACERAIEIARASSSAAGGRNISMLAVPPCSGEHRTAVKRDPFEVKPDEKISLLVKATEPMRGDRRVKAARGEMEFLRRKTRFASTEGGRFVQDVSVGSAAICAVASDGETVQTRSHPNSDEGIVLSGGFEIAEEAKLAENAERVRDEAISLLAADDPPDELADLVMDGSHLCLLLHETIGHPLELDRILGSEYSLAGGSFVSAKDAGRFAYGSACLNAYADSSIPGGAGSFGFDDEGVPAGRVELVRGGRLEGFLASRETCAASGFRRPGAMRASSFSAPPLVRMTNVCLEPGAAGSRADLIADTRRGIYLEGYKSWSIDDARMNFHFGVEYAREIRRGRLGKVLKNAAYTGATPALWRACDAVCGPEDWRLWGFMVCNKGEPVQSMHVGHGCSPARFRQVRTARCG